MRSFSSFSPKIIMLASAAVGLLLLALFAAAVMGKFPSRNAAPTPEPVVTETEAESAVETYKVEIPSEWPEVTPPGAEDRFVLRTPKDVTVSLAESNRWDVADAAGKKMITLWWASDLDALSAAMKAATAAAPAESGPWLVQKDDFGWVVAQRLDDQKSPVEWIDAVLVSIKML